MIVCMCCLTVLQLVKQENTMLWQSMRAHTSTQRQMQLKMHKILYCMYEMYVAAGGNVSTTIALQTEVDNSYSYHIMREATLSCVFSAYFFTMYCMLVHKGASGAVNSALTTTC
jgi:hypothetical protein